MDLGVESRRSTRVPGRFWVAVEGVDAELQPRRGDISATGVYFETESEIGDVGSVQWLYIASDDRSHTVTVMAYVVRVATVADVDEEVHGVALEFMPESDAAATKLAELVRYVLDHPAGRKEVLLAPRLDARAGRVGGDAAEASVSRLSVETLHLETDWAVPVGEPVRVEIIARGVARPIRVEGTAVSVVASAGPGRARYRISVEVREEVQGPLRDFSTPSGSAGPLEPLLSALLKPPTEPPERHHLAGLLSRIPFTSLCSLFELERLSGELTIRGERSVKLFVQDGRFVDVEPAPSGPRAEIAKLMGCRDGAFDFVVRGVVREDRIGQTMTQLMLDLARESDEATQL